MPGAGGPAAYSASMNSNLSLTDAPPQSTPRLLTRTRSSPAAHGFPVPVPGAWPARRPAAAARSPRAFPGMPAPSYPAMFLLSRAHGRPRRQNARSRSPSGPPLHGTPGNNSFVFQAIDRSFPAEDPKGSAVRKDGGAPDSPLTVT